MHFDSPLQKMAKEWVDHQPAFSKDTKDKKDKAIEIFNQFAKTVSERPSVDRDEIQAEIISDLHQEGFVDETLESSVDLFFKYNFPNTFEDLVLAFSKIYKDIIDSDLQKPPTQTSQQLINIEKLGNGRHVENLINVVEKAFGNNFSKELYNNMMQLLNIAANGTTNQDRNLTLKSFLNNFKELPFPVEERNGMLHKKVEESRKFLEAFIQLFDQLKHSRTELQQEYLLEFEKEKEKHKNNQSLKLAEKWLNILPATAIKDPQRAREEIATVFKRNLLNYGTSDSEGIDVISRDAAQEIAETECLKFSEEEEIESYLIKFLTFENASRQEDIFSSFIKCCNVQIEDDIRNPHIISKDDPIITPWDINNDLIPDPLIDALEVDRSATPDLKYTLRQIIYSMYSFAANGNLVDVYPIPIPFSIGIERIGEELPPCNPEQLKLLLQTVLDNYIKIKSSRADYLIEQKAQAEKLLRNLAKFSGELSYDYWHKSPFFPQGILIGEAEKKQLLEIFSNMSYHLQKNIPADREKFFENIAKEAANVIFKEEVIPATFVSNLKLYLCFSFTNEPTQFSDYAKKLFSGMIEADKVPFTPALGDPRLDFASLESGRLVADLNSTLQGSAIPLSEGIQLFDRLLNGSKSAVTLESFINKILSSKMLLVSSKFPILSKIASLYSYLKLNRSLMMEQYKKEISFYVENISKQREELLTKFELVINDEKLDKFKNSSKVEFKDFENIEGGKYLGRTLEYIKEYSDNPVYQRALTDLVMTAYERAANGKVRSDTSPLEDLILETSRLPLPTSNFPFYVNQNKKLLDEFVNCYLMIKRDRELIPELKKRANAFQGMQKRMVAVLNRIGRHPEASQLATTPRWVKTNSFAYRHLARVAPTTASMSERVMVGHSIHQPVPDYFRASVIPGQSNWMMNTAKGKLLRELDVEQQIAFDEIYLLNTAEIEKPLQSSFRYKDVTQISEESFRKEFEEILLHIDQSAAEAQTYMFGFKMRPKPTALGQSVGTALTDKIDYLRNILNDEIRRHAKELISPLFERSHPEIAIQDYEAHPDFKSLLDQEIKKYHSSIFLVGIVDSPTTPFIVIPRIDPAFEKGKGYHINIHLNRFLMPVMAERGFTPTMQKTIEYISTNAPFFHPMAGRVGEVGPSDSSLQVNSIKALREHQIFRLFKALSSSEKAREAEVTFIMHNTMKLIESIDEEQERAIVDRFTKEGNLSLLQDSFALVLSSMRDVLDFEFGLLPRDTADMVRVKEHVMEQVFMWLDSPLPQPKTEAEEMANRQILLQKRDLLERYMDRAHFETLGPPDFSQFVAGGGMNALTTVLKGYVELKNGPLNIGEYDDSYYRNANVFKSMETNKIQQTFTIKSLEDDKSLDEMISQLQKNKAEIRKCEEDVKTALEALRKANERLHQAKTSENFEASLDASDDFQSAQNKLKAAQKAPTEIDILFVDPHASPTETHHVIKANNIDSIIQRMMGSGVISPLFTVAMDITNLALDSREISGIIKKNMTTYGSELDIVTFKSCQKFDSLGSDKLTGGYVALFSKRKEVIETFKKLKVDDPIDRFNVESFTHIFKNFSKEIAYYQKKIFENTALCYRGINPKFIFDPHLPQQRKVYFDRSEDSETYFNSLNFPNTLDQHTLYEQLHTKALLENWMILLRFSFGFEISTVDNIGTMKIRIKNGIEGKKAINQFSRGILNKFYRDVCKAVGEDPGPLDLRYEDAA